ncbi:hypothetical protein BDY24DRAFT_435233 [Mrakia frigida]|uniref:uncharacterized protein n=1 Tax=Mrakia frigida TaxID=29902 RepID=UPI003FCBFE1C
MAPSSHPYQRTRLPQRILLQPSSTITVHPPLRKSPTAWPILQSDSRGRRGSRIRFSFVPSSLLLQRRSHSPLHPQLHRSTLYPLHSSSNPSPFPLSSTKTGTPETRFLPRPPSPPSSSRLGGPPSQEQRRMVWSSAHQKKPGLHRPAKRVEPESPSATANLLALAARREATLASTSLDPLDFETNVPPLSLDPPLRRHPPSYLTPIRLPIILRLSPPLHYPSSSRIEEEERRQQLLLADQHFQPHPPPLSYPPPSTSSINQADSTFSDHLQRSQDLEYQQREASFLPFPRDLNDYPQQYYHPNSADVFTSDSRRASWVSHSGMSPELENPWSPSSPSSSFGGVSGWAPCEDKWAEMGYSG